jgi:type III pantothenate kinase
LVVIGRKYRKRVFLEFEKEVEVHFFPMMTIFLSSIGMKHHKHWESIGWFLLWRNLAVSGLNRLVIDAGTCVTFDFIDESDKYLGGAIAPGCNCVTSHYMILLLSCHCYLESLKV